MARQSLFNKACNLISSGRLFINNRFSLAQSQSAFFSKTREDAESMIEIPPKPKRPLTPFFRFLSEHRAQVVKANPHFKNVEVIKKCSEDWKTADSTLKEKYEKHYKDDMKEYTTQHLEYTSQLTDVQKQAIKEASKQKKENKDKRLIKKKIKASNKPPRPLSPYMQFIKHQKDIRDLKYPEALKTLAAEWKQVPENEKEKYKEKYLKEKEEYSKVLLKWEEEMIKEGNSDLVRKSMLDKKPPKKEKSEKEKAKKVKQPKKGKTSEMVKEE